MAETPIQRQLVAGVRAARRGNKERAKELLEGVLRVERNNEQAWIWLASIVDTNRERRICLERVLKINPDNRAARAALNSMVGVIGGGAPDIDYATMSKMAATPLPELSSTAPAAGEGGAPNINIMQLLIGAAVILGVLFGVTLIIPLFSPEPEPTPTPTIVSVAAEVEVSTATPTRFMTATTVPSPTFSGTVAPVTREATLPPTFTPTVTLTPTNTPLPTATLPPVNAYEMLFLGVQGSSSPSLYRVSGTDPVPVPLISNIDEIEYNAEVDVLVYARTIRTETSVQTRLFLTSLNDPTNAIEITGETLAEGFMPSLSPDGSQVAFVSSVAETEDIFIYDIATRSSRQITRADSSDIDPSWSPDGTQLVFASDRETPGRYELFVMDLTDETPDASAERITDSRGDNIQPNWSPSDNQIAYLSINGDEQNLRLLNLDSGAVRRLTFQPNNRYSAPDWTTDGQYIVYTADDRGSLRQIYFVLADDPNRRTLFPVAPLDASQVVVR